MHEKRRTVEWAVMAVLALAVLAVAAVYVWKLSHPSSPSLPVLGSVPDFTLTNQLGQPVDLRDLAGRVWVADIIFTRCAGPCPKMTAVMKELNEALSDLSGITFLSLTADPAYDTPAVLTQYAARFNADPERWMFLTGPTEQVNRLAVDGLKLALIEKDPSERENMNDLFVHSTAFTLVDKRGRLRGFFQGLEPDSPQRLEEAIRALVAER